MKHAGQLTHTPGGRTAHPATIMLGCTQGVDPDTAMPKVFPPTPIGYATHFNSEGMRRKLMVGKATVDEATHTVPIYRGLDNRAVRVIKNDKRQADKKSVLAKLMKLVGENV